MVVVVVVVVVIGDMFDLSQIRRARVAKVAADGTQLAHCLYCDKTSPILSTEPYGV